MCLSPIKIKNVNRGQAHLGLNFLKDCDNAFMYVPCGHCPECIAAKQAQIVQRVTNEAKYNHLFFATLTYDNKHLPVLTVEVPVAPRAVSSRISECSSFDFDNYEGALFPDNVSCDSDALTGYACEEDLDVEYEEVRFPYADIHHVQLLLKRLRNTFVNNQQRNLRYLAVSELGKKNGRPHFHILFMVEKRPEDYDCGIINLPKMHTLERVLYMAVFEYWSVNVGTRKEPVYEKLFTYRKRFYNGRVYTNFDLHFVDPNATTDGEANVAYYVTKYLMKGSDQERRRQQFLRLNLSEDEYQSAWNTIRTRVLMSKGLGLDSRFYTIENESPIYEDLPSFAERTAELIANSDDLPCEADLKPRELYRVTSRSRVLVPNFDLVEEIRRNVRRGIGETMGPVWFAPDGTRRPLASYYQHFSYIYTTADALDYYFNTPADCIAKVDPNNLTKDRYDKAVAKHHKQVIRLEANSSFDTSPALLDGTAASNQYYQPINIDNYEPDQDFYQNQRPVDPYTAHRQSRPSPVRITPGGLRIFSCGPDSKYRS